MFKNRWKITEFYQKNRVFDKDSYFKKKNVFLDVYYKTQTYILELERCSVLKNICCTGREFKFNSQNLS